ncbi:hypothetical protein M0802_001210 [Mischocyttarus mexicanus]|nr:hypothetical protein M0802_001210 [Mischocyttarus mexicanus]
MDPTILPEEIWIKILLHCDVPDIIAFSNTCRYLRNTFSSEYLWKIKWLQLLSKVKFQFPGIKQLQSHSVNFKGMCYRLHMIITLGGNVKFPKCYYCNEYTCKRDCVESADAKVIIEIGNKYTWIITPFDYTKRHFSLIALPIPFSKKYAEEVLIRSTQNCSKYSINNRKSFDRKIKLFQLYDAEFPVTSLYCRFCNPFNLFKQKNEFIKLHNCFSSIKSKSIYNKLKNYYSTDTAKILNMPNIEVFSPAKALLNSGTFLFVKILLDRLFHKMHLTVTLRKPNAVLMFCEPLAIHPTIRKQLLHYLFQEVKVARVCLIPKPLAVCAMLDIETCIVVDSGALNTTVAVIIDGRVMPRRWKLLPVGGWNVAFYLKYSMYWKQKPHLEIPISSLDTLAVKEKCRLSYNIQNEKWVEGEEKIKEDVNLRVDGCNEVIPSWHILFNEQIEPIYEKVSLGPELYTASELMYINLGLPKIIKEVTFGLSKDTMHDCFSHILLTGGNTELSGFNLRLTKDLRELLPEYSEIFEVRNCPGMHDWNVTMGPTNVSLATHLDKTPPEYVEGYPIWLSREEYVLFGCDSLG